MRLDRDMTNIWVPALANDVPDAGQCAHNHAGDTRMSEWFYDGPTMRTRFIWCHSCGDETGIETEGGLTASLITV